MSIWTWISFLWNIPRRETVRVAEAPSTGWCAHIKRDDDTLCHSLLFGIGFQLWSTLLTAQTQQTRSPSLLHTKNKTQFGSIAFPLMENQQQQRQPASVKSRFRRVCVFCGSSPGKNPSYQLAAIQLGKQLVPPKTSLSFFFIFELNERMRASSGTGFLIRPPTSEHHVLLTWHDLFLLPVPTKQSLTRVFKDLYQNFLSFFFSIIFSYYFSFPLPIAFAVRFPEVLVLNFCLANSSSDCLIRKKIEVRIRNRDLCDCAWVKQRSLFLVSSALFSLPWAGSIGDE